MAGLLALEAVDRSGSVCFCNGDGNDGELLRIEAGQAAARLPRLLHDALAQHGRPRALAVANGPGSFTGLRISVVAARTLAWLEDLPLRAVDSLAALAAAQGPGLWWVLLPLKRDVTFHGLFRVDGAGLHTLSASSPCADQQGPELPATIAEAVAVGPALRSKPDLARRWCPGIHLGDDSGCDARAVARAARWLPDQDWRSLLPAYHMASAPELQRARRAAER